MMTSRRKIIYVATVYLRAVHDGRDPLYAVCEWFRVTRATAGQWVSRSRELGYLPTPPLCGHWPRLTRWDDGPISSAWIACEACMNPWPCTQADTIAWLERLPRML
ncbi:hypothetical protein ACIBG8_54460 [Nonomuraea sp. NPDC050556]|uniref:hypothetical protein n=1 Tax=Nonomuraea sp. NPDC050556 TaxID=3364369 RepID=UPI00378AE1BE